MKKNFLNTMLDNTIIKRIGIILITAGAIFSTAGSCSLPGFNSAPQRSYGVLKQDPDNNSSSFVRFNSVRGIDGSTNPNGLDTISGLKIIQKNENELFLLTKQKGLFKSDNGGKEWRRFYIFPVGSNATNDSDRQREFAQQIAVNDRFIASDVVMDPMDNSILYVSGKFNRIGKIFKSSDSGNSFQEVYSEVDNNAGISFVAVSSVTKDLVYGILEKGVVIRSTTGGQSWSKIKDFADTPMSLQMSPFDPSRVVALLNNSGIAYSDNQGQSWVELIEKDTIPDADPNSSKNQELRRFERLNPIPNSSNSWIAIADQRLWIASTLDGLWEELILPLQDDNYNLLEAIGDPKEGANRLYVTIDNRLLISTDRGLSWSTDDKIKIATPIGNIAQILIDNTNNDVIYLLLVEPGTARGQGSLGGF